MASAMTKFHSSLLTFLDELVEQFPAETHLSLIRIFLNDSRQQQLVITEFSRTLQEYSAFVDAKDDSFLNTDMFEKGILRPMRTLWYSPDMDDETRHVIWAWLQNFKVLGQEVLKKK